MDHEEQGVRISRLEWRTDEIEKRFGQHITDQTELIKELRASVKAIEDAMKPLSIELIKRGAMWKAYMVLLSVISVFAAAGAAIATTVRDWFH